MNAVLGAVGSGNNARASADAASQLAKRRKRAGPLGWPEAVPAPERPFLDRSSRSEAGSPEIVLDSDQTELAMTQEAMRATSEKLLHARDEERERIAIELHDSTSQHLTAIGLGLTRLRMSSPHGGPGNAIIDDISRSLKEALKEIRVLSYLLEPRSLGQDGLSAAALQFLQGFARRTGLEVALEAGGTVDDVPLPLQHAALRIIQEALINASRHAQARRVSVEIGVEGSVLTVSVTDDGCGMRLDQGEPCLGVGIPGMRARAQQFSGRLAISSDESGTRIVAMLPF